MGKSILETIEEYIDEDIAPFSMPGHKQGRAFQDLLLAEDKLNLFLKADLTEVDGLDNLHHPEEMIKECLEDLSNVYGSKKSYFLVNGSTSGNLAMIFAAFNEGDEVLVERGCHRSIFNAIILRKLKPIYLEHSYNTELGIDVPNNSKDVIAAIEKEKNIKGVILTYPNYYGIGCDLKSIADNCKKKKIYLIVDSAHGAHFGFNNKLPENAVKLGVDAVVESAHKTLPSFTQTAYLHINNVDLIPKMDFYISVFSSTSPSYMFMLSLEYSKDFVKNKASTEYERLINRIKLLKNRINSIDGFRVIDKHCLEKHLGYGNFYFDDTRIVINVKQGLSGHRLLEYLRENKVQAEMSNDRNVVLIPTPFNINEDYDKLLNALNKCNIKLLEEKVKPVYSNAEYEKVLEPYEVLNKYKRKINFKEAEDSVAGDNIVLYPPGTPLIVMGEKITKKHIEVIQKALNDRVQVLGVDENMILVIEEI